MSHQITELTFLKYLAPRYGITVPEFLEAPAHRSDIQAVFSKWGKAIAKADILTGGRGKSGAVKVLDSPKEAVKTLNALSVIEVKGAIAKGSYLVQYVPADYELYAAITYNSQTLSPAITVSLKGGVDVESIEDHEKLTFPVDIYGGLDAYQAGKILKKLKCPQKLISPVSRELVKMWDMFSSTGMKMCEINPWRISNGKPVACDYKAVFDEANFKQRDLGFKWPEYPQVISEFEEDMNKWSLSSHQGQAHVSDLNGKGVLPILFGGGASTIITETLLRNGGDPMFLSDFGGNPPYERMKGTADICFKYKLPEAGVLLILGGKANNTNIEITFNAIADSLLENAHLAKRKIPVIVGRGGPKLMSGLVSMRDALEELEWPHVIFGHDTPITMVAQYAANLYQFIETHPKMEF